ncbi:MAG: VOC family protein [Alphaproteobacteria bacterium]|nr:MAG: VOC family protein [Alphaproteobacteria bacterium]
MIDHISVGVDDLAGNIEIYDAALAAIGWKQLFKEGDFGVGYGPDKEAILWVQKPGDGKPATAGNGSHLCFRAPSRAAVEAFHAAALAAGAMDDGAPGLRPEYTPTYYAAFFRDLTGNKIEAVCFGD